MKTLPPTQSLTRDEAELLLDHFFSGTMSEDEIEMTLERFAERGTTIDEVVGMARGMRKQAVSIPYQGVILDNCGTGGSGLPRMNISTVAAFVLSAAGVVVGKHGNRAASGRCGSFDLLEALDLPIELPPEVVARTLTELRLGFIFAPLYHPGMRHVMPVRKKMGRKTIFNMLGPLTNPLKPQFHLLGASSIEQAEQLAEVVGQLDLEQVLIVSGADGLDDVTLTGSTHIITVTGSELTHADFEPEEVGIRRIDSFEPISGGSAKENAELAVSLLAGRGPRALQDLLALNVAFGLLTAKAVKNPTEGVEGARRVIASGAAQRQFENYKELTNRCINELS
ncbi:anthranilate phosphoribosyltransferase [Candidatus Peregrinibacteria bacterium CG_4_9_14_0_2_um_filter_53_11]|nr:MAG: anthranilate phosphoribosyltransferase [Candidatus Peregrinibacteria bacterium CG_4_9_14_0_2_um_filter_53_11]